MSFLAVPEIRRLLSGFPPRLSGFDPGSSHVGFVVDKVALGPVFSEYFGFSCQLSFHKLLHIHSSSGATKIDKSVAVILSGLSLSSWKIRKKCSRNVNLFFFPIELLYMSYLIWVTPPFSIKSEQRTFSSRLMGPEPRFWCRLNNFSNFQSFLFRSSKDF
jgi:hypothetical protein